MPGPPDPKSIWQAASSTVEHSQCGSAVSRFQFNEQRTRILDISFATALRSQLKGNGSWMIFATDENQGFCQAPHRGLVDYGLYEDNAPYLGSSEGVHDAPAGESELDVRIETKGGSEALMLGPLLGGAVGLAALLGIYLGVLSAVSGWSFTVAQLAQFWPYITALGVGFGIQVALYLYLRQLTHDHRYGRGAVAASGTTSTAAMLACCTHYLANILPVLGAAGAVTLVAQYQLELFWVGLAVNAVGILYVARQCYLARRHFLGSHAC